MERSHVFDVLNGERKYQNHKDPTWQHEGKATVGEELLMMEEYLRLARTAWTTTAGDEQALEILRKVVGIGIRCFENHGVPVRHT